MQHQMYYCIERMKYLSYFSLFIYVSYIYIYIYIYVSICLYKLLMKNMIKNMLAQGMLFNIVDKSVTLYLLCTLIAY
jgi:hypothetical protein